MIAIQEPVRWRLETIVYWNCPLSGLTTVTEHRQQSLARNRDYLDMSLQERRGPTTLVLPSLAVFVGSMETFTAAKIGSGLRLWGYCDPGLRLWPQNHHHEGRYGRRGCQWPLPGSHPVAQWGNVPFGSQVWGSGSGNCSRQEQARVSAKPSYV